MSTRVTQAERQLIEELLEKGMRPYDVGQIVGRGERTIFYVQAEQRRKELTDQPSLRSRIIRFIKGETNAEKGINTRRMGENRRA